MKILFLHGMESNPHGTKVQFLRECGYEVVAPALTRDDFAGDIERAQTAYDEHQPDVVVGSSRGGALAMNINTGNTPVVLIAPAWKHFPGAQRATAATTILQSAADDLISLAESQTLLAASGLDPERLIVVGEGHRMSDPTALEALRKAVERAK